MKTAVIYIYPQVQVKRYFPLAERFANTWKQFPPSIPHDLYVVLNGGDANDNMKRPFKGIKCEFVIHNNLGWDIGAYQMAAEHIACDLMVCLGAPAHFYRHGWLEAMEESFLINGPGLYGCTAYQGQIIHVRTTIFWLPPELLASYPLIIGNSKQSRYEFEHGKNSLTQHVLKSGFPCIMVTTRGCFFYGNWHNNAPTKDEILVRDQHIHEPGSKLDDNPIMRLMRR